MLFWKSSTVKMEKISAETLYIVFLSIKKFFVTNLTLVITDNLNEVIFEITDHEGGYIVINNWLLFHLDLEHKIIHFLRFFFIQLFSYFGVI